MVPERLVRGPVHVRADAPVLLRRHGDALVLLFVAHDERSGTRAPILPDHRNLNWVEETFRWDRYWTALAERGYTFVPPGDRRIAARVSGAPGRRAQRWDPRTGERTDLPVRAEGDQVYLDLGFDDGSMAVVVLADDLPPATRTDPGPVAEAVEAGPGWQIEALSTADNSWGDLAGAARSGVLPVQVWQFAHRPDDDDAPWQPVHAGFGPYVQVRPEQAEPAPGERGGWQPGEYSLSHGIRKDPLHFEYLGPKAMVPEEFLAWPDATPGRWVAFRTALDLPAGSGRRLSVGANADRRVYFDGAPAAAEGTGYWTLSPVPDGAGRLDVEVWLRAEGPHDPASPGPTTGIRACFAVVADERRYRRPEWLVPTDGTRAGSTVEMSHRWTLAAVPARAVLQVAAEGACTVLVNGEEVGRQGDFDPYAALRTVRVQPYVLTGALRAGENVLAVRLPDGGRQVAVLTDGLLDGDAALGTDLSWTATRDGAPVPLRLRREQWTDPRWVCLRARPHPLPRAAWLDPAAAADGVVLDLVPDASREAETAGVQWLRFAAPAGLVAFGVATTLAFTAVVAGVEYAPVDGRVRLPEPVPGGTEVLLRVLARGGRRGGSLLDGPVEAVLAPVPAELATWAEWGLRSLAGAVTYRQRVTLPAGAGEGRWTVDLGEVRGTAEVSVNGRPAGVLAFGPYRLDVSGLLRPGDNDVEVVVRGTLAGYLDDVSPTPAIAAGQTRTGLLGPVRFVRHAEPAAGNGRPGAG
ncbi:MAG TPA: hypothetical protein VES42_14260, partial [Pilimelia sp.]|nr:hypothetical protein [Pilimelia sp.]